MAVNDTWLLARVQNNFLCIESIIFFQFLFHYCRKNFASLQHKNKTIRKFTNVRYINWFVIFFISRFLDRFLTVQVICISLKSYKYIAVAGVRAAALVNKLGGRGRRRYYQRLFIYPFIYRRWLTKRNNFISVSYNILYHNRVNYIQSDKMKKYEYYLHATL